ncbi:MAG: universal stress protein [Acidimicrobiales bacterium]
MSSDIVVGIDGSENSGDALEWAIAEAKLRGVRVRAVLTWSYMGQAESVLGWAPPSPTPRPRSPRSSRPPRATTSPSSIR